MRPCVGEDLDAPRRERGRHHALVVMVAENGENAVGRGERRERVGDVVDVGPILPRHVITAEHDEVGLLQAHEPDRAIDVLARHREAPVQVGHQANAQTRQCVRQT